jgi:hypothetical protein
MHIGHPEVRIIGDVLWSRIVVLFSSNVISTIKSSVVI